MMILLYNMMLLRETQPVFAHQDYTLQAPLILQHETIDADLTRLQRAMNSLPRYLSFRQYNQPRYLRDLTSAELKQLAKDNPSYEDDSYDDIWACTWDQIPIEITKVLLSAFSRGF
jgi:hypothetical protein